MGLTRKGIAFPSGLIAGQKLGFLLKALTLGTVGTESFDELPIPFRCAATDIATGEKVVHEEEVPFYTKQTRLVFGLNSKVDPESLEDYLAIDGYSALGKALTTMKPEEIIQEVITLSVFVPFAVLYMHQPIKLDYLWAGLCILGAVYFMFRG